MTLITSLWDWYLNCKNGRQIWNSLYSGLKNDLHFETVVAPPDIVIKTEQQEPQSGLNTKLRGPWNANKRSRYVELVLVVDHQEFLEHNQDLDLVYRICKDVANVMNALYSPLNIYIGKSFFWK